MLRMGLAVIGALFCILESPVSHAGWLESVSDWFDENMVDAEDGNVDISDYLSGARGFFPVPIIITEPAVGFGAGAAVAYFHHFTSFGDYSSLGLRLDGEMVDGGAKTTSVSAFSADGETVAAGGVGFRYRIARKLGMQLGMDVARGPEETSIYLTVGSAW